MSEKRKAKKNRVQVTRRRGELGHGKCWRVRRHGQRREVNAVSDSGEEGSARKGVSGGCYGRGRGGVISPRSSHRGRNGKRHNYH